MAGKGWKWTKPLALIVVLAGAMQVARSQAGKLPSAATCAIAGKLTDLHSQPLADARVVVRNQTTGAEAHTFTGNNGNFRFTGLEPGEYRLDADSPRWGHGRLEGILVVAGHVTRLQTAMEFGFPVVSPAPPAALAAVATPVATLPVPTSPPQAPLTAKAVPVSEPPARLILKPLHWPVPAERAPVSEIVNAQVAAILLPEPLQAMEVTGHVAQEVVLAPVLQPTSSDEPAESRFESADPASSATSASATAEQLQALPVSGRRWQDFVLDSPTAVTTAGGAAATAFRGSGATPAETSVDGAGARLAFGGTNGGSSSGQSGIEAMEGAQAWAGGRSFAPGVAAIHRVETEAGNTEAQAARSGGGRINVETERGTNDLHGQTFFFDRQQTWGAQNPFTQWVRQTAQAAATTVPVFTAEPYTPPDHEMNWGLGVGGRLRRDKLFWFTALDGYQRNDPGVATVKHPSEFFAQPNNDQLQVLSGRLGLGNGNPVGEGLVAYSSLLTTLGGLLGPAARSASQEVGFGRLDWELAERHRLTFEGIGATWDSPGGGLTRTSETYGARSFGLSQASQEWLLGRWEAFLTPNLLLVTQGSAGRAVLGAHAETPSDFEKTFLSPSIWGQLPQMVVDSRYGFTIGKPTRFGTGSYPDERLFEASEGLNWVRDTLLLKAGLNLDHNADATSQLVNQTGTYSYANVENFASDALAFAAFGIAGQLSPSNQHNCDRTGKVWRDSTGQLHGLGYLPCYAYYSQTMGPTNWNLSTNDWAGYATAQWQPKKRLVISAGLRWEREQLPPPIAALDNRELPLTERLPSLGNNWGPRISMAIGGSEGNKLGWPLLRLGYGMYFGRTENATVETALTHTGSSSGDMDFFLRPTDNLHAGGAPPFPYVLAGEPLAMVKPGAVEFASSFRNPEVHQGVLAVEESLPGHLQLTASAMFSLGRRLPVSIDTNFNPAFNPGTITYDVVDSTGLGPIKTSKIEVPFYASWPSATSPTGFAGRLNSDYQQITQIVSRANSTYEAATFKVVRYGQHGLSMHAHYTYAHAMDWNPNETSAVTGGNLLDPGNFSQEYGASNLDMRHSASAMVIYQAPWKLQGLAGRLANGWMVSGTSHVRSGLPYTMRTAGSLAEEFNTAGTAIVGLGPGMNGSGGDNRVYGVGRNTYRYPGTWKADMRLGKRFDLGAMRQLELLVESFNLFNHQNVTELETTGYSLESGSINGGNPTLHFLNGLKANSTAFGQPLNVNATSFYSQREVQAGLRLRF